MPRLTRLRPGPIGLALTLLDVWNRMTPRQRKQVIELARKHGPRAAERLMELQTKARRGRRPPS